MRHASQRPARARTALLVLLFLGSSALAAFALFAGLRELLPYESFEKRTAEERFLFWEGVLWMLGLAMVFLGGAGAFGTLHLVPLTFPSYLEIRSYERDLRPRPYRFTLAPWWVLSTGAVLLILVLTSRGSLSRLGPRAIPALGGVLLLALAYTTPWDSDLIRRGVWG